MEDTRKNSDSEIKTAPETPKGQRSLHKHPVETESRLGKLKVAFLYTLIVGLGLAALTSVIALLVGEFNAVIGKTLLTIFILFSHSLLLLAILWADTKNQLGKAVISTTIFAALFANLVTSTLGAWEIISASTAWRWVGLYFLAIGGAYIVAALLRLRLPQRTAHIAVNTSVGFVVVTLLALTPWVLHVVENFDPLYFRIVAALSILSSASFLISLILRGIASSKNPELRKINRHDLPNGMLSIYIVVGVITAITWNVGLVSLIDSGSSANNSSHTRYNQ
ncbi:hypothetical protein KI440_01390 [Candidatus Saccharibacteria bacterium TM7i]|nr:hypothetical protein KI440_01390 [Candidatus Saccharibacteria bacterium TM7i]